MWEVHPQHSVPGKKPRTWPASVVSMQQHVTVYAGFWQQGVPVFSPVGCSSKAKKIKPKKKTLTVCKVWVQVQPGDVV